MAKIIRYELDFPNTPEVVWSYITDPELIALWLMPSEFKAVVGHEFTFQAPAMPDMDFDGTFYCKVLEVNPPKTLSYSWKFGPGDGTLNASTVHWTLAPTIEGTRLELIHRGFEGKNFLAMFDSMSEGWIKHINKIKTLINVEPDGTAEA